MAIADLTVFGAGIFGLSVAWSCARRGARVQVIDPAGPGAGASGGVVGALAPHAPDQWDEVKAFQFAALAMAPEWWAQVTAAGGGDPGYGRTGRLQPIADAAAEERARARGLAAADLWGGDFGWEVVGLDQCGPFAPVSPTGLVIRDTLSARINPRLALAALVAAISATGGNVVQEGEPKGRVLWATGHAGLTEAGLGGGVKGQAALLAHDAGPVPQIYAGSVHVVPHADGRVAIGSTSERDWDRAEATDAQLDAVIAAARAAVPALGRCPPPRRQPPPAAWPASGARRRVHRQWRVQDRLRPWPDGGRGDGRSHSGRARQGARRLPTRLTCCPMAEPRNLANTAGLQDVAGVDRSVRIDQCGWIIAAETRALVLVT